MENLETLIRQFKSAHNNPSEQLKLKAEIKRALYREYTASDNYIRMSAFSTAFKSWRDLDLANSSEKEIAFTVMELENLPV